MELSLNLIIRLNCVREQLPEINDVEAASAPLLEVVGHENTTLASTMYNAGLMVDIMDLTPSPMEDTVDKEDLPPPYHTVVSLPPPYSSVSG